MVAGFVPDVASHRTDEFGNHREAESGSGGTPPQSAVDLREALEELRQELSRHTLAVILDVQDDNCAFLRSRDRDGWLAVLVSVVDQAQQDVGEPFAVGPYDEVIGS